MSIQSNVAIADAHDIAMPSTRSAGFFPRPLAAGGSVIPRIVLFDDDPLFSCAIERIARINSIPLVSICDVSDVARIANQNFDLAIVDFDLGDITGIEVAQFLQDSVANVPILMVSYTNRWETQEDPWPRTVRQFVRKDVGPAAIIEEAIKVFNCRSLPSSRSWEKRLKLMR